MAETGYAEYSSQFKDLASGADYCGKIINFLEQPSESGSLRMFKPAKETGQEIEQMQGEESGAKECKDGKWVRCRNCHYKIALFSDKLYINDVHTHLFKNPAGIFFRVICFSNAPGSFNISEYTEDNSWFSGYSWSITICRSCNNHLGWHYSGPSEFYGLIADRLSGI